MKKRIRHFSYRRIAPIVVVELYDLALNRLGNID